MRHSLGITLVMVAACWRGSTSSVAPAEPSVVRPARVEGDPLAALRRDVRAISTRIATVVDRLEGPTLTDDHRNAALDELRKLDGEIVVYDQRISAAKEDGHDRGQLAELERMLVAARMSILNTMLEDARRQMMRLKAQP